jgi:hypothetical protein
MAIELMRQRQLSTLRNLRKSEPAVARLGNEDQVLRFRHTGAEIKWIQGRPAAVEPRG